MTFRQSKKAGLILILVSLCFFAAAQNDPTDSIPGDPGGMTLYTTQNLSFGAFSHGNTGGTVTVSNNSIRSATGDVVLLNMGVNYYHSIFEIDTPVGSVISIMNGSETILNGSNGGTIILQIGNSDPPSPFLTTVPQPGRTLVNIGGAITVGSAAANPAGIYTGTFYITFNQE